MKVLSLFDGVSCARLALEKAGIPIEAYYASEIDKYATKVTQANRPDTIQIGNIKDIYVGRNGFMQGQFFWKEEGQVYSSVHTGIDLLIGGSPCQDLSIAKKNRKGLDGDKSSLFYEYLRILKDLLPEYFILENVASMPKKDRDIISFELGIEPIMINASLVSGQNRKRLFWVGKRERYFNLMAVDYHHRYKQVTISQPEDKSIFLKDILEESVGGNYQIKNVNLIGTQSDTKKELKFIGGIRNKDWAKDGKNYSRNFGQGDRVYSPEGKSATLSALGGGRGAKTGLYQVKGQIRKLTPIECERLQCMPDNWTNPTGDISNTQRYKMCGNAFNVDVVAHIIKFLK